MRRHDKQIAERTEINELIHGAEVCHLGLIVDGEPYVVPISFGYDGAALYFHTAPIGRKIAGLEADARICFQLERQVELLTDPRDPCRFSFAFESVIGWGRVAELHDPAAKQAGLNRIMRHYSGREWRLPAPAVAGTRVWRLEIDELTGKRSPAGPRSAGED